MNTVAQFSVQSRDMYLTHSKLGAIVLLGTNSRLVKLNFVVRKIMTQITSIIENWIIV